MDKKFSAFKELIIKNRLASGKNFTEAWVSHIPDDPTEHGVDELSEEHLKKLIEEDDATYLEPGDSASQVGCLARQVSLLLKSLRQDGSSPSSSSQKTIPRRFRALLEQLGNAGAGQLKKKPPKVPRVKKDDAEAESKVTLPKEEAHFAVPAVPSLTSNVSKKRKVASVAAMAPLPSPAPLPEPEKASETKKIASNVEKSSIGKAPSSRKSKGLFFPVSNVVKAIQRYASPTMKCDQNFVNSVAATGIVYAKKVMDQAERIAHQNGHDAVHTSDMLEVFKMEHGTVLAESYMKRMEELLPNL